MTLGREEVVAGTVGELRTFSSLVAGLSEEEWLTPTRCAGWMVADITAHVAGLAADVAAGRLDDLARPDSPERHAAERRGRAPQQIREELDEATVALAELLATLDDEAWAGPVPAGVPGVPGGVPGTLGFGVEAIWYETYLHGDDIRDALGRPSERGPGLRAAVSHVAGLLDQQGWGPATLHLDDLEPFAIDDGGPPLGGDPLTFLLVATGRAHPIELGLTQPLNVYASCPSARSRDARP